MKTMRSIFEAAETSQARLTDKLVAQFCVGTSGVAERMARTGQQVEGKEFAFLQKQNVRNVSKYWTVTRLPDGIEVLAKGIEVSEKLTRGSDLNQGLRNDDYWTVKVVLTAARNGVAFNAEYAREMDEGGKKHIETLPWRNVLSADSGDLAYYVIDAIDWIWDEIRDYVKP
jgi:hypothetical protein